MSGPDFDGDDMVQQDIEKGKKAVQNYREEGSMVPDLGVAVEQTLWALTVMSVVFLVGTLPFVGPGKAMTGEIWMGVGMGGIIGFGTFAFATRWIRQNLDDQETAVSAGTQHGR